MIYQLEYAQLFANPSIKEEVDAAKALFSTVTEHHVQRVNGFQGSLDWFFSTDELLRNFQSQVQSQWKGGTYIPIQDDKVDEIAHHTEKQCRTFTMKYIHAIEFQLMSLMRIPVVARPLMTINQVQLPEISKVSDVLKEKVRNENQWLFTMRNHFLSPRCLPTSIELFRNPEAYNLRQELPKQCFTKIVEHHYIQKLESTRTDIDDRRTTLLTARLMHKRLDPISVYNYVTQRDIRFIHFSMSVQKNVFAFGLSEYCVATKDK